MFAGLKAAHKISGMSSKWLGATGSPPPNNDQILSKAMQYVQSLGLHAEDAWLVAFTNYLIEHPEPYSQRLLARSMLVFLDAYEGRIPLSANSILAARGHAEEILEPVARTQDSVAGIDEQGISDAKYPIIQMDGDRAITECPQCRQRLRVPYDRLILIRCSVCNFQFEFGPYVSDAERQRIRDRLEQAKQR